MRNPVSERGESRGLRGKKGINSLFICIISLTLLGCKATLPERRISSTSNIPSTVKSHTLKNGIRLIIKEEHHSPVVALTILVSGGSASEGKRLGSGITHLLEHIIFKGTDKYPPGEIERVIKSYGGEINGFTTHDYTGYKIVVLKEGLNPVLDILKEMLTAPSFDKDEIEKEKGVILREVDLMEDNPLRRISNLLWQTAYIRHPYKNPVIGYRDILSNISKEDLVEYFDQHYVPQNIVISIVGDIDQEKALTKTDEMFGQIPRRTEEPLFKEEEPSQLGTRTTEDLIDIEGAYLSIGFHSTSILHRDLFAIDLLATVLGRGESSRLFNRLIKKEKKVFSISCYNYTPKDKGLFIISAALKEELIDTSIDSILNEIDKIKTKGITKEELIEAKNSLLSDYIFSKERLEDQSDDFAINMLMTGNPNFSKVYIDRIREVNMEDIKSVANKYLHSDNMNIVTLRTKIEKIKIDRPETSEIKNIENLKLKNGLDVLLLEDHALPCIWMYTMFKGGLRVESEKNNGICKLLSKCLLKGTKTRTAEEIARIVDSKGGIINAFSENNSLGVSLLILKENTNLALELLSDILQNSIFLENELEIEKTRLLGAIDMQDNQIFNQANRLLKETLFLTHPYKFQSIGKKETVGDLSRNEILEFYNMLISPKNCVLAIAGDFEKEEIKSQVETYFGKWLDKGYKEAAVPQEVFQQDTRVLRKRILKNEAVIFLGLPGITVYNKDRYCLEVLLAIISGGGNRLYQSLREEKGLAYAVGGFSVLGIDPGYIAIYVLVSPEDVEETKALLFKEIEAVLKGPPSEEELNRAKNYLKGMFWINNQPSSSLLFSSALDELYGLGFENYKRYLEEIDKVKVEDVLSVAKKYLDLKIHSLVILSPKE